MKVLVATSKTQGQRADDFFFCNERELVFRDVICGKGQRDDCGCERSLVGAQSQKSTTTMEIVEVDENIWIMEGLSHYARAGWIKSGGERRAFLSHMEWYADWIKIALKDMPVGAIVEYRAHLISQRIGA